MKKQSYYSNYPFCLLPGQALASSLSKKSTTLDVLGNLTAFSTPPANDGHLDAAGDTSERLPPDLDRILPKSIPSANVPEVPHSDKLNSVEHEPTLAKLKPVYADDKLTKNGKGSEHIKYIQFQPQNKPEVTYNPSVDDEEDAIDEDEPEDDDDDTEDAELPAEQRLMIKLMNNYEKSVRPVKNATNIVLVKMGLTLTQIFDMDEKDQILVTNVWLDQEWGDVFFTWDPADYGGLEVLRLPCSKIWLPDIVLYNNAAQYTDGLMPANAMITHQGDVFWPVPTKLQSTCKVDVTYFPFDEQHCKLKFGSWTYDGFQVDMTNRSTDVDLSNYVENGEWELLSIKIKRNVVRYACCDEPFPDVTFIIHIRRRTIYYLYNVIFPCVMMSVLTLLVFCLPPESGEKITLGITVLLAFSVFLLRMGEDLPETSEFIPLLSIYLTIVMSMTSVSVVMAVLVLNLHFRGPSDTAVPRWIRKLFLRRQMSRDLFLKPGQDYLEGFCPDMRSHYVRNVSMRLTIERLANELKDELDSCTTRFGRDVSASGVDRLDNNLSSESRAAAGKSCFYNKNRHITMTNEDILKALKKIIERYQKDDDQEVTRYEWRQVALAVDRILFFIFLLGTLSSTVIVLIIAPLTKWL